MYYLQSLRSIFSKVIQLYNVNCMSSVYVICFSGGNMKYDLDEIWVRWWPFSSNSVSQSSPNSGFNLSLSIANTSVNYKTNGPKEKNSLCFIFNFRNEFHFLNFSKNIQTLAYYFFFQIKKNFWKNIVNCKSYSKKKNTWQLYPNRLLVLFTSVPFV